MEGRFFLHLFFFSSFQMMILQSLFQWMLFFLVHPPLFLSCHPFNQPFFPFSLSPIKTEFHLPVGQPWHAQHYEQIPQQCQDGDVVRQIAHARQYSCNMQINTTWKGWILLEYSHMVVDDMHPS
jgi:hypothetical protein